MAAGKEKQYRNFWVPMLQKAVENERVEKPVRRSFANVDLMLAYL